MKNRKQTKKRWFISLLVCVAMLVASIQPVWAMENNADSSGFWQDPLGAITRLFSDPAPKTAGNETTVSDPSTLTQWEDVTKTTTENIGRIWNDKTVSNEDITLTGNNGQITHKITKGDSDFLVGLSALSSYSNATTTVTKPLDIVLVLDDSGSMDYDFGSQSTVYLPAYEIETGWGSPTYYAKNEDGSYTEIDKITGSWGRFDHWELNGQRVEPKTSATDSDPSHIQFYEYVGGSSRVAALQSAVSNFIDRAQELNATITDEDNKIQIAEVSFESSASTMQGLTVCDDTGAMTLKSALTELQTNGATRADFGLQRAVNMTSGRPDAQKVVIFFTDGTPTSGNSFEDRVANAAITSSKTMKDAGTNVYSVGIFDGADPTDDPTASRTSEENKFMHGVSSNYPNATAYNQLGDRAQDADYYLAASDADGLNQVFDDIFNEIKTGSGAPTEVDEGFDGMHGGYITFTDKLGDYMQVDDFNSIVFADYVFKNPDKTDNQDGTVTYTFHGEADPSPAYPNGGNVSNILITVTRGDDLQTGDTVEVKIPAGLIPLKQYDIDTNAQTMTITDAYPMRVFYGVSLKDQAKEMIVNGAYRNDEALSAYIAANTDATGVHFYSNAWSGHTDYGDTSATFTPADGNKFYYFTEDTPVYTDEAFANPATKDDVLKKGQTLYYQNTYYEQTGNNGYKETTVAVAIPSDSFEIAEAYWSTDPSGHVYIKKGAPHLTRTNDFYTDKTENRTGTADHAQNPTWAQPVSGQYTIMNSRLGNNGRLTVEMPGALSVTKKVGVPAGFNPDDYKEQSFTMNLNVADANGSYQAELKNTDGTSTQTTVEFNNGDAKVQLKADQTLTVYGLNSGSTYTVEETDPPASFTPSYSNATGMITANTTSAVTVTNIYKAEPTGDFTYFSGHKRIEHRDFKDGDTFTFNVKGNYTGSAQGVTVPMPSNVQEDGTLTITPTTGTEQALDFGTLRFSVPGTYTYTITEELPDDGISNLAYSKANYTVTITVTDNHNGTLTAKATAEQTKQHDGTDMEPTNVDTSAIDFVNTYTADAISRTLSGQKNYTDTSGAKPLERNMFQFVLKPAGDDAATTPMPEGSEGVGADRVYQTGNGPSGRVAFGQITYTQADVGKTYQYTMSEVIPDPTTPGMTYDKTTYTANVAITQDEQGGLNAMITYPEGRTFTNTYDPEDVTLTGDTAIGGTKTLTGRDMKESEAFTFTLTPDANTKQAIEAGSITGIDPTGAQTAVSGAENGEQKAFNFGSITFNRVGTYHFTLKEEAPAQDGQGMTYDRHECPVIVTITDDNGKLQAAVAYGKEGNNNFTNTYTTEPMDYGMAGGLRVAKTLNGRNMKADEFTFTITGSDEAMAKLSESDKQFTNETNGADGVPQIMEKLQGVTFNQADADKTFTYTVAETKGTAGGVTYDTATYTVAIQVIDNGDGTMHTLTTVTNNTTSEKQVYDSSQDQKPTVAFVNNYAAESVTVTGDQFSGTKTLTGRDGKADESFGFALSLTSGDASAVSGLDQAGTATVSELKNSEAKPFQFGNLTFSKAGTYTFGINEVSVNGAELPADGTDGMTYDRHTGTITVNVTDQGDGKLTAAVSKTGTDFTNTYKAGETAIDGKTALTVTKVLNGRNWIADDPATEDKNEEDQFSFSLSTGDETTAKAVKDGNIILPEATELTIGTGTPDHHAAFGNITFKQTGNYTFTITEKQGELGGVTYDTAPRIIEVSVTDNGSGQLEANVTEGANPTIINTYTAGGVDVSTDAQFTLTKQFTGRPDNQWLDTDTFTFTLTAKDNAPMPEGTQNGVKTITVGKADADENGVAKLAFGEIRYDKVGTYQYTVAETKGNIEGVGYATNTVEITVTVADNLQGGLTASVAKTGESKDASFVNTYKSEVTYDSVGGLNMSNVLYGCDMKKDQFKFTMTPKDRASAEKVFLNDWTEGKAYEFIPKAGIDGEVVDYEFIRFGEMVFTPEDEGKAYTYIFAMEDTPGEDAGYTYDHSVYTVTITAKDDGKGNMTVTTAIADSEGEHSTVVTATKDHPQQAEIPFINYYEADPIVIGGDSDVVINAHKVLNNQSLTDSQFSFKIIDKNNQTVATGTNDASGNIRFDAITYTTEGLHNAVKDGSATLKHTGEADIYTFTYTVAEVTDSLEDGYTYVSGNSSVTVTITDDLKGTLTAAVSYPNGKDGLEFINTYGADATVQTALTGNKVLSADAGLTPPDIDGAYTFSLTGNPAEDGTPAPMPEGAENGALTAVNTQGAVDFGNVTYTMENVFGNATGNADSKTFTYTVTESGKVDGITNDAASKTISVTVKDNGDGTLSLVKTADDGAAEGMDFTFRNHYAVSETTPTTPADSGITIRKVLKSLNDSHPLTEGAFTFKMTDSKGQTVAAGTNDADGNVSFSGITFKTPGTYSYTVSEVIPEGATVTENGYELNGITYTTAQYTATAEVKDNGDGTLSVDWRMADGDGSAVTEAVFTNSYAAKPVTVTFGAIKTLDGRALEADEFTFTLCDAEGKTIAEATNDAKGQIVFDPMHFDTAGEYIYTIAEVVPHRLVSDGITYDQTEHTVKLVVSDNGNGDLVVTELTYDGKAALPVFTNQYAETAAGPITGTDIGIAAMVIALLALGVAGTLSVYKRRR